VLSVVLNNALPVDMSTKSQITSLLLHYTQKYLSAILITITLQHIGNFEMIFLPGVLKWWMEMIWAARAWERRLSWLIALLFARTCT